MVRRSVVIALALFLVSGCVGVAYQTRVEHITPQKGKALLFGRLRFFHDDREFFPWNSTLLSPSVGMDTERHLWFLRLDRRATSAEVHPDPDGSLAIWLPSGDYALIGSTRLPSLGADPDEVVALFRVPADVVAAYAGELDLRTESHEGAYLARGEFGKAAVALAPIDSARAVLERRLGTLPAPPVAAAWCAGPPLPGFHDRDLAARAKVLLDRGCGAAGGNAERVRPLAGGPARYRTNGRHPKE